MVVPVLLIFLLGGVGASLRFAITQLNTCPCAAPYFTLLINVLGSFAIGLLSRWVCAPSTKLVLMVGLLGGFTTFATYAKELAGLLEQDYFLYALGYCLASNGLSLCAVYVGMYCSQLLLSK